MIVRIKAMVTDCQKLRLGQPKDQEAKADRPMMATPNKTADKADITNKNNNPIIHFIVIFRLGWKGHRLNIPPARHAFP